MAPGRYLIIGAGLLASVMADGVSFTEWPASLTPGQSVTLRWTGGSDAPTTITLRKGASTDLHDVQVLTDNASDGVFSWTPPADLQNSDDYAFQINQGDDVNYTSLLPLTGGSDAPTPDDKTQQDVADVSGTASATDASATASGTDSASATEATAPTAAASGASNTQGNAEASITSSHSRTETASPSKMNTPFVGAKQPSSTPSALENEQTDAASRAVIAPLSLIAGSFIAFLLFIQ